MEKIIEGWKDIEGYEGLYQVSNLGRVKSLGNDKNKKEKIRKVRKNNFGYLHLTLHKNRIAKDYLIHRLVATAWIPNPNNLPEINHKDECKTNNTVENLEWCDATYNNNYGTRIIRMVDSKKLSDKEYYFRLVCQCCRGLKRIQK